MMNGQSSLKIIKARVEQDKYAAVELKVIKANGVSVMKDMYVEREFYDGELFAASDNVLVALHRTLRNGEVANLELITNTGEVLLRPEYSEIKQVKDNLFVGVKAVSGMPSVQNNQLSKTDALKVQEIALDIRSIKEQMNSTMMATNPSASHDFSFLFEDAYQEAAIYKIEKQDGVYQVKDLGSGASFIATDGVFVYVHSNVVTDTTKVVRISDAEVMEKTLDSSITNRSESVESVVSGESAPTHTDVSLEKSPIVPEEQKSIFDGEEEKKPATNDFFSEAVNVALENDNSTSEKSEEKSPIFDEFFGVSDLDNSKVANLADSSLEESHEEETTSFDVSSRDVVSESVDTDIDDDIGADDKFERLSDMIATLVSDKKASEERAMDFEAQIEELNEQLRKVTNELESKSKKVNVLINQNRQFGDENRMLKNRVNGLQDKTSKLEATNQEYLEENEKLKARVSKENDKLNGIISSVSELLGSYGDEDNTYAVKKKVA